MSQCKRYTEHQSGNRKLHSTETLNVFITDQIVQPMDRKEVAALVLIDLSKAFDSIDHSILLVKLQTMGVSKSVLAWFKSYLLGRSQIVYVLGRHCRKHVLYLEGYLKDLFLGRHYLTYILMTCPMFQKSPLWNLMLMIRKSIWHFQFTILKLLRLNLRKIWKELPHGAV
jgi:hypothetical protein